MCQLSVEAVIFDWDIEGLMLKVYSRVEFLGSRWQNFVSFLKSDLWSVRKLEILRDCYCFSDWGKIGSGSLI